MLETALGWAYAQGYDLPLGDDARDALVAVVYAFFASPREADEWLDAYRALCHGRAHGERRACRWYTVVKTVSRSLPMATA